MFKSMENIKLINSKTAIRPNKVIVKSRNRHVFIIRVSGSGMFDFGDRQINSTKGTLLFIPKGASYEFTCKDQDCISTTINFDADIKNAKPMIYDISGFADYERLAKAFPKIWARKTVSYEHKCLSLFHSLIAYLIDYDNIIYSDKRKYKLIEPAIEYIESNFADTNLRSGALPSLCNISPAYFRRIFMANIGISPQKYIEEKRLEYAMFIIEETHNKTIAEIASLSGYKDALYFGKAFKKKYGVSPSYYKREE